MIRKTVMLCAMLMTALGSAQAHTCDFSRTWMQSSCERVARVADEGTWDLYVTGYGWHIDGYTDEYRRGLNAKSWGGGAGKHWTDANGHEDIIFALAFLDSHKHVEPIAGYARQWFTRPVMNGLSVGGGFMASVSARNDILHYMPFPIAAPMGSVRYRSASLMATLIPRIGGLNRGDVMFIWGRYEF
jgi:hypothetical protein